MKKKIALLIFAIESLYLSGCGRETPAAYEPIETEFRITTESSTLTPPTSISFQVSCNGGSAVSVTLTLASSSSIMVQKYATCTLDMTSITIAGLTYTPSGTHLIICTNTGGVVSSKGAATAKYTNTTNSVTNQIYFKLSGNASNTPYLVKLNFSSNLSRVMALLPRAYLASVLPATAPTITGATYAFNTPASKATTTLTLSASNASGLLGALSCVVVRESAASAPTSHATAATQYSAALSAINLGTIISGLFGNTCATSNAIYCKCPSAFNGTLLNGSGNWDAFYTSDAVIIWINASISLNSAFSILVVPGLS